MDGDDNQEQLAHSHDPLQDLVIDNYMHENNDSYLDEQTYGEPFENEVAEQHQYEELMYKKMNKEYCVKEDVEIRFSLSPKFVNHLFMYRRKPVQSPDGTKQTYVDDQLFNIIVSKHEDWTALKGAKHSMRQIVYSICRNIIMTDRRAIVKGRWHSVLCLLNLLYDSLFMSEEQLTHAIMCFPTHCPTATPKNTTGPIAPFVFTTLT